MEDDTSIWSKKQSELTVGESIKLGVGVSVISIVAPVLIFGTVTAISELRNRYKNRKYRQMMDNQDKT